jgi:serine phosphatase RsbU (regulator of sigma subunit)
MGRFIRRSLALRVLLISVLFFALPLLVYFFVVLQSNIERALVDTVVRLRTLGESRALLLGQVNTFTERAIDTTLSILRINPPEDKGLLFKSIAEGGDYDSVFMIQEEKGSFLCTASSNPAMVGTDFSDDRFVHDVRRDGETSFLAFGPAGFQRFLFVAKLIYGEGADPIGILVISQWVDDLIAELVESEGTKYPVDLSLITRSGVIFASGNPALTLRQLRPLTETEKRELQVEHNIDPSRLIPGGMDFSPIPNIVGAYNLERDGIKYIAVAVPVEGTSFALLLDASRSDVFGTQWARIWHILIIFGAILVVGGGVTFWMARRMERPLARLIDTMHDVSSGDLAARFSPLPHGFEINRLGTIFNETMESLGLHMERAEEEKVAKETYLKELEIGREIQRDLLPHQMVEYPGVEIAARFEAAKEVGGDFYDIFIKEGREETAGDLVLTVADAAGKGISACLFSFGLRSMLRSYCVTHNKVGNIMREANNLFHHDAEDSSMFVTAFMAIYDPRDKTLTYSSSGHVPALLHRTSGDVEMLTTPGIPLGIQPAEELPEKQVQLHPGDLVLFYTDGVTEAVNHDSHPYGEGRLIAYLRSVGTLSAENVADGVLNEVHSWAAGAPQFDDITVMTLKIL